jgi:hypothetical protein
MQQLELAKKFHDAMADMSAKAKDSGADLIGHAHMLYFGHRAMSASQINLEIEYMRQAMMGLNAAFTKLDLAHAAMTVGETASKIRGAAE